eukprot:4793487-Pleurochrysis_carterae.AAC.1
MSKVVYSQLCSSMPATAILKIRSGCPWRCLFPACSARTESEYLKTTSHLGSVTCERLTD